MSSPKISAWAERRRKNAAPAKVWGRITLTISSIYGGFFGAGLGVILTAVLSIERPNDIRQVKALKNLLATFVSLSATIIFVIQSKIRWPETCIMFAGAMIGGFFGGYLMRILPAHYIRRLVIIAGTIMTVIYINKFWF